MTVGRVTTGRATPGRSRAEARLAGVLDAVPGGIAVLDASGVILEVNAALATLAGLEAADLVGRNGIELVDPGDLDQHRRSMWRLWRVPGASATMHIGLRRADGTAIPVSVTGAAVSGDHDADVVLYVEDQRDAMAAEARVDYLSRIDTVTGLLNRRTVTGRIGTALRAADGTAHVAVVVVDLDRFQTVNDRLGHTFGDHVLSTVAARMTEVCADSEVCGNSATVGRLGADEFVVVVARAGDVDGLLATARAIRRSIAEPIHAGDESIHLTATVGIAVEANPDAHAEALVQRAVIALHGARAAGRTVDVADEGDARAVVAQLEVEAAVSVAIHDDGLYVVFQPIYDAADRPVAVEALVRAHDDAISAADIVAAAERSSLILDLGRVVLDQALAAMPTLDAAAGRPLQLNVNLSARQIHEPTIVEQILGAVRRHGFPPSQLCVELTETAAMSDPTATIEALSALRRAGVSIAIDDFGAGYSSFSYLRDLPVDRVKVDQAFLHRAGEDAAARQVLEGMVGLCAGLGLESVCEGVENTHQRDVAIAAGATGWQGYLGSRPLPADELAAVLVASGGAEDPLPADEPDQVADLLADLGMVDLLVFRRLGEGRYAHLGGVGRGAGWAGVVEIDLAAETFVAGALGRSDRVFISSSEPVRVVGPYYATTSLVVATDDALVVLGHPDEARPLDRGDPRVDRRGAAALAEIVEVSPAKPLADELEVLEAVQELLRFDGADLGEALAHLLAVTCDALGCDVGFACLPDVGVVRFGVADDVDVSGCSELGDAPRCLQYAAEDDLPGGLVPRLGIRSWYLLPLHGGRGRMLVAHTADSPRGFTGLCQRVGRTLAESSDVLFRAAQAREELTRQVDQAASEARTDALTGLANRLGWDEAVEELAHGPGGVGVLVADLDRFKELNDTHGHAEGDRALKVVARVLAEAVAEVAPSGALAARIGGDEFGVVLPTEDPVVVEQLRRRVRDRVEAVDAGVSCTVGTAWTEGGAGLEAALIAADRAMYAAKLG